MSYRSWHDLEATEQNAADSGWGSGVPRKPHREVMFELNSKDRKLSN